MQGLKSGQIAALERLYKRRFPLDAAYLPEQARELALLSRAIGRQVAVLIDRRGRVFQVLAGEPDSIMIPELPPVPAGASRLRGLRLLHTHLDGECLDQEDLMDLLFLRLDAIQALTVDEAGEPQKLHTAWLVPPGQYRDQGPELQVPYHLENPRIWHLAQCDFEGARNSFEEACPAQGARLKQDRGREKAILVSVSTQPMTAQARNLDELEKLVETAGLEARGRMAQRVKLLNPKFILGRGKLAELELEALQANADVIIFDGELSPAQLHNLADLTERKVLDRTQLILDIFAQNAKSKAGKLQVELAQLAYAQPRLAGRNKALDRLMGGIGGRGPGESRLETDRRKSRKRMACLKKELERLRRQRALARNRRLGNRVPTAALVGYTNAGKSTLLNRLTASTTEAANRLFATLDPVTRRLRFPQEREFAISDTVGFIRNLPVELKEAFQATLEELYSADLLIHVTDASHPDFPQQMEAVETILSELGLGEMPRLLLLNKCDCLAAEEAAQLEQAYPGAIPVSGRDGTGLDLLLKRLEQEFFMEGRGSGNAFTLFNQ